MPLPSVSSRGEMAIRPESRGARRAMRAQKEGHVGIGGVQVTSRLPSWPSRPTPSISTRPAPAPFGSDPASRRRSPAVRSPRTGPRPARTRPTCRGCCAQSMLADANEISQQFSGQGSMWQNPFATPNPRSAVRHGVGVVHRLPAVVDHPARRVIPQGDGRRGDVEGVRRDRHRSDSHRPGETGRRDLGVAVHPQRGRPLRPDQHPDRPGVRHRRGVPQDVRAPPTGTAAPSSTTSCPAIPARVPTSGSRR